MNILLLNNSNNTYFIILCLFFNVFFDLFVIHRKESKLYLLINLIYLCPNIPSVYPINLYTFCESLLN